MGIADEQPDGVVASKPERKTWNSQEEEIWRKPIERIIEKDELYFYGYWPEIAIAACDLAEILGMAIGIQLLTGLPLIWGVSIYCARYVLTALFATTGYPEMEAFIIGLIAVIGICFLVNIIIANPQLHDVLKDLFLPCGRKGFVCSKRYGECVAQKRPLYT
jgi:NRAMP (natural resistance-associated macrophage protein)-like metal ion transporter